MAMIGQPDFSGDKEQSYGLIPAGRYPFDVVKDDYKPTKAGTGYYAEYQLKINDGPHAGRVLFARFNLENPNPVAVEIGRGEFKAFAKALGHPNPNMIRDTSEMTGRRGVCTVIIKGTEADQTNEIKAYFPNGHLLGQPGMNGAPTYQPQAPQAPQAPAAPAPTMAAPPVAPAPAMPSPAPAQSPSNPVGNGVPIVAGPAQVATATDPFAAGADPFSEAGIPAWT